MMVPEFSLAVLSCNRSRLASNIQLTFKAEVKQAAHQRLEQQIGSRTLGTSTQLPASLQNVHETLQSEVLEILQWRGRDSEAMWSWHRRLGRRSNEWRIFARETISGCFSPVFGVVIFWPDAHTGHTGHIPMHRHHRPSGFAELFWRNPQTAYLTNARIMIQFAQMSQIRGKKVQMIIQNLPKFVQFSNDLPTEFVIVVVYFPIEWVHSRMGLWKIFRLGEDAA